MRGYKVMKVKLALIHPPPLGGVFRNLLTLWHPISYIEIDSKPIQVGLPAPNRGQGFKKPNTVHWVNRPNNSVSGSCRCQLQGADRGSWKPMKTMDYICSD